MIAIPYVFAKSPRIRIAGWTASLPLNSAICRRQEVPGATRTSSPRFHRLHRRAADGDWQWLPRHRSGACSNRKIPPCRSSRRRGPPPTPPEYETAAPSSPAAAPSIFDDSARAAGSCWAGAQRQIELRREFVEQQARLRHACALSVCCSPRSSEGASSFTAERQLGSQKRIFSPRLAIGKSASASRSPRGPRFGQQTLRDQRPAAAARLHDVDPAASALQNLNAATPISGS